MTPSENRITQLDGVFDLLETGGPKAETSRRVWDLREKQKLPGEDWSTCLWLAGRGFGKTLALSNAACEWAQTGTRGAVIGPTAADVRDVVVEGESGILNYADARGVSVKYEPSKRRLTWPNGAIATTYSADEPDRLRGPQHHWGIADELAAWRYARLTWDNFLMGLRLGADPRAAVATTPRPIPIIREMIQDDGVVIITGTTYENLENLSPVFRQRVVDKYEGTRIGRQELYAEVLEDTPGALWTRSMTDAAVANCPHPLPDFDRVVVAIDPAVTSGEDSDETGIIVAGRHEDSAFIIGDYSGKYSPEGWAKKAVSAAGTHLADRIVAEVNNGGDMVEATIRTVDRGASYESVRASRGKLIRAEPVAALYEQGRVFHADVFSELEEQLSSWAPGVGSSPDRLDALVWAVTALGLTGKGYGVVRVDGGDETHAPIFVPNRL